jgi:hypothetical protein
LLPSSRPPPPIQQAGDEFETSHAYYCDVLCEAMLKSEWKIYFPFFRVIIFAVNVTYSWEIRRKEKK